jgi:transcription termination factor Rho
MSDTSTPANNNFSQNNHRSQQNGNNNNNSNKNSKNGNGGGSRRPRRQTGGNYNRNNKRNNNNNREEPRQTTREDLEKLKAAELRAKAAELNVTVPDMRKRSDLVDALLVEINKSEGFKDCEGILELLADGYGFLRTDGYLPSENDVYVGVSMVRRNGLRKGDYICGQSRPGRDREKYGALTHIKTVNGIPLEEMGHRVRFGDLTPVYPNERYTMEHGKDFMTARVIDLVAPIGKGQRGLIVSPPKAGKTTILKDIAAAITANNPDAHLMCLLVDERPEEVTDMERSIKGEVISSTFDMPSDNHIAVSELVIERAKRLVECGRDVVILLDSITRLARAYNLATPASGRILSGGVDSTALYPPKRFLGAARNIEGGGSLTILASALVDTGSKMDEVIFEEFKGTGNMELKLDRELADRRVFPAIDPVASGTRKEELLLDPQEMPLIWAVRRILANMNNTERSMEMLIKSLKQTQNNVEFLMRTAKRAQKADSLEI